ncbi:MAG TPA: hypothetical protein VG734_18135 [Lacunisphaera sp.]|nr:hypothetical protein [Lacunisphaera sp.]
MSPAALPPSSPERRAPEAAGELPRATGPAWPVIWRTTLLTWIPQTVIWYVVVSIHPGPAFGDVFDSPVGAIVVGMILAPCLETGIVAAVLFFLRRWLGDRPRILWYSAAFFGALHFPSVTWGLHAVWAFYMFSRCYLSLVKSSPARAFWVTTAVHAGCNLLSYLGTLLWRSMA